VELQLFLCAVEDVFGGMLVEPAEPKTAPSNLPAFSQKHLLRIKTIAIPYG
jgi:hypothetical protein